MSKKPIKIAIDGPAASGKSTTARELARRLGYLYIDSGAMYRAVTLKAIRSGVDTADAQKVAEIARRLDIQLKPHDSKTVILMDGEDVSDAIRSPEVDHHINPVAANPAVREILVKKQQEIGRRGGIVMDGRDIGTVVFPDAELKIFMKATPEERARRRVEEYRKKGIEVPFEKVLEEIRIRDRADETRSHGPLKQAPDAVVIDTTGLSIEEQIERAYHLAMEIIQKQDC